ncbi:MAG: alanine racemase [Lentisphaeria bacterium]|nr:alanine racemase [Lentisphaeria bacterium]
MPHRVSLEVDIDKLEKNFKTILERVSPAQVMAVVKADAYGLGVQKIAPALKNAGASFFGVADINEALEIAHFNLPVQVLGNLFADEIADAVKIDLICPLNDFKSASRINAVAARQNKVVRGALTIDSGMGRIGMVADSAFDEIVKIKNELKNIEIFGIYSHFATSGKINDDYTLTQMQKLQCLYGKLKDAGILIPYIYIAASGGIANYQQSYSAPFNLVRAGITMYGYCDSWQLEETVQMKARLISVRELPANSSIGYNRLHTLSKKSLVGTIGAGYADGIPLALSNCGHVLVNGIKCPIVGRISMDYTTILLDDVPDAEVGDEVVLFGRQHDSELSIRQWTEKKGTHLHDILCGIGNRVKRIYKYNGAKND